jgi:hypothetical protein
MKKMAGKNRGKNLTRLASELQAELINLQSDPIEREAMRYFNFIRWLESEIQQVPYRTLAEKELKQ